MHLKNHMKVVLVDIDGVLLETKRSLLEYLNCLHNTNIKYSDLKEKNILKYFPEVKGQDELEELVSDECLDVKTDRSSYSIAFSEVIKKGRNQQYRLHAIADRFFSENRGWKEVHRDTDNCLTRFGIKVDKISVCYPEVRRIILDSYLMRGMLVIYIDDNIDNLKYCVSSIKDHKPMLYLIDRPWNRDIKLSDYNGRIKRIKSLGEFLK